ncbi:hypothetical protein [Streptomyces sp. C36]|uniref:hypothetical protein n=1 Tax=Streptomyces sp. C36 TaxID=3237122 RepID=UPI0034C644D6
MSDVWSWEYDPDREHVAGGVPGDFVAEVERLIAELVELAGMGADIENVGIGPRRGGGMRELHAYGGYFYFLPLRRKRLIVVTRITPPFKDL